MAPGRIVTVERYETDRYGDRVKVSEHRVAGCAFAPRTTAGGRAGAEFTDRANTVTSEAELYVPYGADIVPEDVIRLHDNTQWEVVGLPERWESPFPGHWRSGSVVPIRRRTG